MKMKRDRELMMEIAPVAASSVADAPVVEVKHLSFMRTQIKLDESVLDTSKSVHANFDCNEQNCWWLPHVTTASSSPLTSRARTHMVVIGDTGCGESGETLPISSAKLFETYTQIMKLLDMSVPSDYYAAKQQITTAWRSRYEVFSESGALAGWSTKLQAASSL